MADEEKKGTAQVTKTMLKVVLGIVLLVVGVCLIWLWRWDVGTLIKGCLGIMVVLAGVILLAIAKE